MKMNLFTALCLLGIAGCSTRAIGRVETNPPAIISVEPLTPSALGAVYRPRVPGSMAETWHSWYIGSAPLDFAYRLRLSRGIRVRRAEIVGYAPVHLVLGNGRCFVVAPRIVGQGVAVDTADEPCSAVSEGVVKLQADRGTQDGPGLVARTISGHISVWTRLRGGTVVRVADQEVMRLPIETSAVGSLPILHGGGDALTLFGKLGSDPVIVSVTVPAHLDQR